MNDPQMPTAPDPTATAKAQSEANTNTAITQQLLNQTNQVTPYGTLSYTQDGTSTFTGADGKSYTVPKFTATTTLTPDQQRLLDLSNRTKENLGNIGVSQSAKIGDLLGTNFDINSAAKDQFSDIARKRLDPLWTQNEDALRTRLTNSGIQPGSEAWNAEMRNFNQSRNDAYDTMFLQGRGQAVSEALAQRNQPINEISALTSGSAVSQPNFASTPTTAVAGTDVAGITNSNYQNQMAGYNAQLAKNGATMGGLFGLGGTLGAAGIKYGLPLLATSDRRLKRDIVLVGVNERGLPVYEYTIFGRRERGVMADEVAEILPGAVVEHPSGFKMVDYSQVR